MRPRLQHAAFSGTFQSTAAQAKKLWALRRNGGQPHTWTLDQVVRLTDHTALDATPRVPQPGRCGHFNGTDNKVTLAGDGLFGLRGGQWTIGMRFRPTSVAAGTLISNQNKIPHYQFDGTNDFVSVPDHAALRFTNAMTWCAWVRLSALNAYHGLVAKTATVWSDVSYSVRVLNTNVLSFVTSSDGSGVVDLTGATVLDGAWHHLAVTHDGTTKRLYVDGVLDASATWANEIFSNTQPVLLGRYAGNSLLLNGGMRDVRLYSIALSGPTIADLAAGTTNPTANLVAHWRAADTDDTTATDAQGTHHGTKTNITPSTFHSADGVAPEGVSIRLLSGDLKLQCGADLITLASGLLANTWYTVAVGYDRPGVGEGTVRTWLATGTAAAAKVSEHTFTIASSGQPETIGAATAGPVDYFSGYLSMAAAWSEAPSNQLPHSDTILASVADLLLPRGHDYLFWFEDGAGTTIHSSSGLFVFEQEPDPPLHGTLVGTVAGFHDATGANDLYSRQNDYGFSAAGGGVYYPRCENDDTGLDISGDAVQYAGRVSYGPIVVSRALRLSGSGQQVLLGNCGIADTIDMRVRMPLDNQVLLSLGATSDTAIRVSSGVLTFGGWVVYSSIQVDGVTKTASEAGAILNDNLWHRLTIVLNGPHPALDVRLGFNGATYGQLDLAGVRISGSYWPLCEGGGTVVYDCSSNGRHRTHSGTWDATTTIVEHLITFGAARDLTTNSWIPGLETGSLAANGLPLTHGPGKLLSGQTLTMDGGQPLSPFWLQYAAQGGTTYSVGDGKAPNYRHVATASLADHNLIVALPPLSAGDFEDLALLD